MFGGPLFPEPRHTPEDIEVAADERRKGIGRRASTWERRILSALAAILALGIGVRVVLAIVG